MKRIQHIIAIAMLSLHSLNLAADEFFDLTWNEAPSAYQEGAFLGNGEQGTNIWASEGEILHFDIGDTRIYDDNNRLPIGKFVLHANGQPQAFSMRLSMQNAEATGTIQTDQGEIAFQAITVSDENLNLVLFQTTGGESIDISHFSIPGIQTRKLRRAIAEIIQVRHESIIDYSRPEYQSAIESIRKAENLPTEISIQNKDTHARLVPLSEGKAYTLVWRLEDLGNGSHLLAWRTEYSRSNLSVADQKRMVKQELEILNRLAEQGYEEHRERHRLWWQTYYEESNISIPDKKMEAYYKWQIYKMAAATRKGNLPIDLMGPWFRATSWGRIWANLNIQLTYLPMSVANKPEIASTLTDFIDENQSLFIQTVPDESLRKDSATSGRSFSPYAPGSFKNEYGNFLWILHNYWHFLNVYPDSERMQEKFYPMLKRGINFLLHHCLVDSEGILHTPRDISPEYKWNGEEVFTIDTAYNLGFLHWGLQTAILIDQTFQLEDPDAARYQEALDSLAPLHVDPETGIMLGKDVKIEQAHRHYSHLVSLYPLQLVDLEDPEQKSLYRKSVDHWINQEIINNWSYKGYSRTGAAAMYILLGDPETAYEQMRIYFEDYGTPNTFYVESGPVIETPFSAAAIVHEMLLQSSGQDLTRYAIRLFPGTPDSWKDASFENLRAEGGFIVSAQMKEGHLSSFKITSTQTRNLTLHLKAADKERLEASQLSEYEMTEKDGWIQLQISLNANESIEYSDEAVSLK